MDLVMAISTKAAPPAGASDAEVLVCGRVQERVTDRRDHRAQLGSVGASEREPNRSIGIVMSLGETLPRDLLGRGGEVLDFSGGRG
jgi:hypothetical protein